MAETNNIPVEAYLSPVVDSGNTSFLRVQTYKANSTVYMSGSWVVVCYEQRNSLFGSQEAAKNGISVTFQSAVLFRYLQFGYLANESFSAPHATASGISVDLSNGGVPRTVPGECYNRRDFTN